MKDFLIRFTSNMADVPTEEWIGVDTPLQALSNLENALPGIIVDIEQPIKILKAIEEPAIKAIAEKGGYIGQK